MYASLAKRREVNRISSVIYRRNNPEKLRAYRQRRRAYLRTAAKPEVLSKRCASCKNVLDIKAFSKNRCSVDGYAGTCKACHYSKYGRSAKTIKGRRAGYLLRTFGITSEQYDARLREQDFKCKICGKPHTEKKKLHVDHCHVTQEVRGLLCGLCNRGIGALNHDPAVLLAAVAYLQT